jgi:hypothetical protein
MSTTMSPRKGRGRFASGTVSDRFALAHMAPVQARALSGRIDGMRYKGKGRLSRRQTAAAAAAAASAVRAEEEKEDPGAPPPRSRWRDKNR